MEAFCVFPCSVNAPFPSSNFSITNSFLIAQTNFTSMPKYCAICSSGKPGRDLNFNIAFWKKFNPDLKSLVCIRYSSIGIPMTILFFDGRLG